MTIILHGFCLHHNPGCNQIILFARSIEFSLPSEIPLADSIQAAREMADYYRAQGMCVDLNIHNPKSTPANPHCHLLLTLRPFNEDGTFVRHKSHRE